MNKTLEQILLDWIGNNKQNAEVSEYYSGYNQALSDLRAKVPKLVEKINRRALPLIEEMKEEGRIGEGWCFDGKCMQQRFDRLINSLTEE